MPAKIVRIALVLGILTSGAARAAQVLSIEQDRQSITISQRTSGPWGVDESICVLHDWKEVACGKITEANAERAKLRLKKGLELVAVGDFVQSDSTIKPGVGDGPGTLVTIPKNVRVIHTYTMRLGVSLEAGPNYVFPGGQFQIALDRRTCLGLLGGSWANSPGGVSLTGFGGIASISFYQTRCYVGLWLGLDAGGYLLVASTSGQRELVNTFAGGAKVGYDASLSDHLSLSLSVGGRYLSHPRALAISYAMDPWLYFFSGTLSWLF